MSKLFELISVERRSAKTPAILTSVVVFVSRSMQMQTWFLSLGHYRFIQHSFYFIRRNVGQANDGVMK
jgi:hypothetical protein